MEGPLVLDLSREAIAMIRQGWVLNFYSNCAAIGLTLLGLTGPIGTTLISNGATVLATLNALRPLMDDDEGPVPASETNRDANGNGRGWALPAPALTPATGPLRTAPRGA